jgi:hypothetical protein
MNFNGLFKHLRSVIAMHFYSSQEQSRASVQLVQVLQVIVFELDNVIMILN